MIRFIKGLYQNVQLASELREIASRNIEQPDRMCECVVKAIRKDLAARPAAPSIRTADRLEALTA